MRGHLLQRLLYTGVLVFLVSVISFFIIQLPPGDFVDHYVADRAGLGDFVSEREVDALRSRYGLDRPVFVQYFYWVTDFAAGDMGFSLEYQRPVRKLIGGRLALTAIVSFFSIAFAYAMAIPVGVYAATHQHQVGDYVVTVIGFVGLAVPNFLLALILMLFLANSFDVSVGGLFSPEYDLARWTPAKFVDLLKHLPLPLIIVATASTAGLIRVMRSGLLDELNKQYVITARAKGVGRQRLLFKYPLRVALNPIISTVGWVLPEIVSGEAITAIVLSLPTIGPLLLNALVAEDMYLAGAIVMLLSILTIVGTFISDVMLSWLDPRIRVEQRVGG